jgi:hypothetical protein
MKPLKKQRTESITKSGKKSQNGNEVKLKKRENDQEATNSSDNEVMEESIVNEVDADEEGIP